MGGMNQGLYEIAPLELPTCKGQMCIIAFIQDAVSTHVSGAHPGADALLTCTLETYSRCLKILPAVIKKITVTSIG